MIDESLVHIIDSQQEQIKDLISQNNALQEIILKQAGLLDEKIIVGESEVGHIGKIPWYIRQKKLELLHKKEVKEYAS